MQHILMGRIRRSRMNIIKKCLRKFISAIKNIRDIPKDAKEFGLKIAIVKYRRSLGLISIRKYIDTITQKTKIEIEPIVKKYQEGNIVGLKKQVDFKDKIPVFVSWLQGEDSMPEWCRACYNNIKRILPSRAELVFITYNNLSTYLQIPENIFVFLHAYLTTCTSICGKGISMPFSLKAA